MKKRKVREPRIFANLLARLRNSRDEIRMLGSAKYSGIIKTGKAECDEIGMRKVRGYPIPVIK